MAGANQQVGVASAEVDTLMALSEEQLDEALRQAQLEGAELVKRQKAQELSDVRKINVDLCRTRLVDPVPAPVQRQAAPTHRTSVSGLHARFKPQPTLRDLEFLDQEVERLVRGQVGTRYGLREDVNRPVAEDFERPAGKRGEKSGLRQVLSDNRTFFPQLCTREYLRFEHVRDPIKFDDLDLRLFTAGELNIIDRPDISYIEMRGKLDLLKNILYLAGYYEWRGILQFYATIINQIEMGVKDWDSDFSEERSLVLLPYALSNRRDRPPQGQSSKRPSGLGQNLGRPVDAADNRAWFCRAYQWGECSRPEPHLAFVPIRGPVTVQHICAKCYLTDKKKLSHPENSESCPCPAGGTSWQTTQQSPSVHGSFTTQSVTCDTVPLVSPKKNLMHYMVQANKAVRISGKPNFSGCRIPVPSSLNLEYLEKELADYKDRAIIQLLRYGCPINYEGPGNLLRACHNHRGATDFPQHIERFLTRKVEAVSVMGPFKSSPSDNPTTVSPLNTVPKRDSADRRVIVDLSFPKCKPLESVNGGISRDCYLGDPIQLRYPSVDNLVNMVRCKGPGCYLFKCDLSRAYRQLPVDPGDLHYLGYKWNWELYIDATLTMGLRSAAFLCQRVTNAIAYIARNNGVSVSNYLDDFGVWRSRTLPQRPFSNCVAFSSRVVGLNPQQKHVGPTYAWFSWGSWSTQSEWCWRSLRTGCRSCTGCCRAGWRGLQLPKNRHKAWWGSYSSWPSVLNRAGSSWLGCWIFFAVAPSWGSAPCRTTSRLTWDGGWLFCHTTMESRSSWGWLVRSGRNVCMWCLSLRGRGVVSGSVFPHRLPSFHSRAGHAHQRTGDADTDHGPEGLGRFLSGKKVTMWCNNLSSVVVIQTGKARDPFLQACLRELVFLRARWECQIRAQHIRGEDNRLPDLLSRWESSPKYREEFFRTQGL